MKAQRILLVLLVLLILISAVQAVQLSTIKVQARHGSLTGAVTAEPTELQPKVSVPSSLQSLPGMVGGC